MNDVMAPSVNCLLHRVIPLAIFLLSTLCTPLLAAPPPAEEKSIYIIMLKERPETSELAAQMAEHYKALHRYQHVFHGFAAELNAMALSALQHNPNVQQIDKAHTVHTTAESYPTGADRIDADLAHASQQGFGVRVAIVDTGIDFNHPDLAGQVNTILSDGFISRGKTTVGGMDDHGHGTHVAGTVAAILNNDQGVVGVAPQAELISLKVLKKNGFGSSADIIAALDFITGYNNSQSSYADLIHVANFSLGGSGSDTASSYRSAFERAVASGCFIVVAAGNESDDAANHVPAAYDSVFTVSAMDPRTDSFASFSNYGNDIDIAAPGVAIRSTLLGGTYGNKSGTSMASPHVAGTAALYISQNLGTLTKPNAVTATRTALIGSGEPITLTGDPDGISEPLVDAQAVLGPVTPPDPVILITVDTDKASYLDSDTQALLTVQVQDELGGPVDSLTNSSFDLGSHTAQVVDLVNNGNGFYTIVLDISGFSNDIDHLVVVTVSMFTADGTLSDSGAVTIRKASAKTVYVSRIVYEQVFKNLRGYLTVSDLGNNPVAGATVNFILQRDGQPYKNFSKTTAANGIADFRVGNARTGHYTIIIQSVTSPGAEYEPLLNTSDPGYTVP